MSISLASIAINIKEVEVNPIVPGFDFTQTLTFLDDKNQIPFDFNNFDRIYGQFASTSIITTVDSKAAYPQTLIVMSPNSIKLHLPAVTTLNFANKTNVILDFCYLQSPIWIYIPLQIVWPIINTSLVRPTTIPSLFPITADTTVITADIN
jgi:hypothetical protein